MTNVMKSESALQNILNFTKIEHTAFSLPLIFTGAWLGAGISFPSVTVMLLIVAAAVGRPYFWHGHESGVRSAHRPLESAYRRSRAAGRQNDSLTMALTIAAGGLVVYLLTCWILGGWCLILSPIPLVPLLGYSLLKRFTPFCHFGIGLCLALAPLGAYVAAAGHPRFSGTVILFSGFVLLLAEWGGHHLCTHGHRP
jgi:4-hydroxybenzoate polyprenyltransferase